MNEPRAIDRSQHRLLVVNGRNNILVSDPLDPLHYAPLAAELTANLGEADAITQLLPLGDDTVLICKENVVLGITGLSGPSSGWRLVDVTREYGQQAPLAGVAVGADARLFSRRGVESIAQTVQGKLQGVDIPVSWPMQAYLNRVDWRQVSRQSRLA